MTTAPEIIDDVLSSWDMLAVTEAIRAYVRAGQLDEHCGSSLLWRLDNAQRITIKRRIPHDGEIAA